MPSSTTATSGIDRSSRSESGRPRSLFKLPFFRNTRKRLPRNSAATSFVVVFPALPVIATTFVPDRRRTSRAISCNPVVVFATLTRTDRPPAPAAWRAASILDCSTTAPRAPRAIAAPMNSCPSNRSPRIATNSSPLPIDRESIDRPAIASPGSPCSSRPPVALTMSAGVSGSRSTRLRHSRSGASAGQRRARDFHVVERQRPLADDLIFFVPLPGNQDQISRGGIAYGALDGGLPIGYGQVRR